MTRANRDRFMTDDDDQDSEAAMEGARGTPARGGVPSLATALVLMGVSGVAAVVGGVLLVLLARWASDWLGVSELGLVVAIVGTYVGGTLLFLGVTVARQIEVASLRWKVQRVLEENQLLEVLGAEPDGSDDEESSSPVPTRNASQPSRGRRNRRRRS